MRPPGTPIKILSAIIAERIFMKYLMDTRLNYLRISLIYSSCNSAFCGIFILQRISNRLGMPLDLFTVLAWIHSKLIIDATTLKDPEPDPFLVKFIKRFFINESVMKRIVL
jgi:hypothetical protein